MLGLKVLPPSAAEKRRGFLWRVGEVMMSVSPPHKSTAAKLAEPHTVSERVVSMAEEGLMIEVAKVGEVITYY